MVWLSKIPLVGLLFICVCMCLMTLNAAIVKHLKRMSVFELLAIRFGVPFFLTLPLVVLYSKTSPFKTGRNWLLFARAIVGAIAVGASFYAFRHMPLGIWKLTKKRPNYGTVLVKGRAQVIISTAPIFASFLGCIFLKEKFGFFELLSIVATIVGVVLVMQPPEIFGYSKVALLTEQQNKPVLPVFVALVAAFGMGVNPVLSRALREVNLFVMTAWVGLFAMVPNLVIGLSLEDFRTPNWTDLPLLFAVGFIGWLVMNTYIMAFMVRKRTWPNLFRSYTYYPYYTVV